MPERFRKLYNDEGIAESAFRHKHYRTGKISDMLSSRSPLVLIENDSLIVTGNSLINCFDKLEVADFTAKTLISSKMIGEAVRISDKEVEEINKAFNLN